MESLHLSSLTTKEALTQGLIDVTDLFPTNQEEPLTPEEEEEEEYHRTIEELELKVAQEASRAS
jgi:hypothetical protein